MCGLNMVSHIAIPSGTVMTVIALVAQTCTKGGHLGKHKFIMVFYFYPVGPCKVLGIIFMRLVV